MTSQHVEVAGLAKSQSSSDTAVFEKSTGGIEKVAGPEYGKSYAKHEGDDNDIKYPEPWKYEKLFVGGYSQKRMLKFKKPKSMYIAINLFAGKPTHNNPLIRVKWLTGITLKVLRLCFTGTTRV